MRHSAASKFAVSSLVSAISLTALSFNALAAPPNNSAYNTDSQYSYVEDATSKGIGQVNMITCLMSSMRPDALVNKGNYVALVDQGKCDPEAKSSSSGGGTQVANYLTATVNSSRASNSDPMIAKIWIDDVEDGQKATIFVRTSATTAPSANNPYGIFRVDFCGRAEDSQSGQLIPGCMMQGYLEGASDGLSYYQQENGDSTTALRLNATNTDSGSGRLSRTEDHNNNPQSEIFSFAYNHDYFLRDNQCFSRDANQANFSVWRYGVYDAVSGDRITLNSGFPIEFTPNNSSTTYHGYLGYYGLSLPPEAMTALSQAANPIVQKVDYGNGQEPTRTNYNVMKAAGKLTKYTRKTRTLAQIDKIKINIFVNDVNTLFNGAVPNGIGGQNNQFEVYWDNAAGVFKIDAAMNCDNSGCHTTSFEHEYTVPGSTWANLNQGGVQGYSQSLGGEVFVDLHGVAPSTANSSAITVVYRVQDLVYPSDMPTQLVCLRDCPTAATIANYFTQNSNAQSPFALANNFNPTTPGSQIAYTTNASSALLIDAQSQPIVFTDSEALQNSNFQSGIHSGRLFTPTDLANLGCDNQPSNYCEYKVNELNVYYVWETGSNSFNQFAAVKDTNNQFLKFDAPLQLNYQVPNDSSKYGEYAGKSLVLQYGGFGNLWGVPGQCVSHVTNAPVSCDQPEARYVAAFAIRNGEQVSDDNHTYLVKWQEREIRFALKDVNDGVSCAGLSAPNANSVVLPTAASLKDTSDSASGNFYIGTKPAVTSAPRVIHGDVKY